MILIEALACKCLVRKLREVFRIRRHGPDEFPNIHLRLGRGERRGCGADRVVNQAPDVTFRRLAACLNLRGEFIRYFNRDLHG